MGKLNQGRGSGEAQRSMPLEPAWWFGYYGSFLRYNVMKPVSGALIT